MIVQSTKKPQNQEQGDRQYLRTLSQLSLPLVLQNYI